MACPDFQTFLLPVLQELDDDNEHHWRDVAEYVAKKLRLSDEDMKETIPSGRTRYEDRVLWSKTYLKQAALIEIPKRGYMKITARGKNVLKENPTRIDIRFLMQFTEFAEFKNKRRVDGKEQDGSILTDSLTPQESIEDAYLELRTALADELLEQVKKCPPAFFETLVVELMLKLGYGGSRIDAGEALGRSGDGGIDGIIKEDRLGLDLIYLQAKRWESPVGRPIVQQFAGSLMGNRAKKGVLITTSNFTSEAKAYIKNLDQKISLIDGAQLTELMIDYDLGVVDLKKYVLKKIDLDYFSDV